MPLVYEPMDAVLIYSNWYITLSPPEQKLNGLVYIAVARIQA
jgi:hypothetical protein